MEKETSRLFGLHRFKMTPVLSFGSSFTYITAKNRKQAWAKFCRQRFGALKPSRDDYIIEETR